MVGMIGWCSRSTRGPSHAGAGVRARPFPCATACTLCIRPGAAALARVCSNAGAGVRALSPSRLACSLNLCELALASSYRAWLVPAPVGLFHLLALCSALCSRLIALSWRLEALFYSALIFSHFFALVPPLAVYSPLSSTRWPRLARLLQYFAAGRIGSASALTKLYSVIR